MTADAERVDVPGYEILGLVGRGGMGVVYRARQVALDRVVALKTIPANVRDQESLVSRFEREARAVGRLTHPHIVAAHDFGRHADQLFLAMEFVAGQDAQVLIDTRGCLDEWTTWGIVRQATTALAHAFRHGLVHRDVKPANLLVTSPPAGFPLPAGMPLVKVVDFGLARLVEAADDEPRLTQANRILGTPHYMAPEQVLGGDVGLRADIYALGATAYCMLTGRPPLAGRTLAQIIAAHVGRSRGQETIPSLRSVKPTVSEATAALVEAMMAAEPDRRIADHAELLRRIDALRLVSPAETATGEFAAAPSRAATETRPASASALASVRRNRLVPLGVVLLLVGVAGVAALGPRPVRLERGHVPSGTAAELFDGHSLAPWRTIHGGWSIGRNDEGAVVLEGTGLVSRLLSLQNERGERFVPEQYRLGCLVDRVAARTAEIEFDLEPGESSRDRERLAVRIAPGAVSCGSRSGTAEAFTARATRTVPDDATLHAVEIERQGTSWWIYVDGERLAVLPFLRPRSAAAFVLGASGGAARFSDITLEELVTPAAHSPPRKTPVVVGR